MRMHTIRDERSRHAQEARLQGRLIIGGSQWRTAILSVLTVVHNGSRRVGVNDVEGVIVDWCR